MNDVNAPAKSVAEMLVADDGRTAFIRCVGPAESGLVEQRVELHRPSRLIIHRKATEELRWWHAGEAEQKGQSLVWPDGTKLAITRGSLAVIDPKGYLETKVHFGGMKFADPHPFVYPVVTARPDGDTLEITITVPEPSQK